MRHGSLESGLGGFDYAAEMIGWENIFHCEINPFCRTILNYYWPHAKSYKNIFDFDATIWRGKVDIITAGFPCQPFSQAGKRKGSEDNRHIWPENLRIIKEVQPPFVLAENVPGLLTIERGLVFETVCADLENEGYEVTPFIIPACAKGAVHRRDRIWIVAYATDYQIVQQREQAERWLRPEFGECASIATNANSTSAKHEISTRGNLLAGEVVNAPHNSSQGFPQPGQTGIGELQKENKGRLLDRFEFSNRNDSNSKTEYVQRRLKEQGRKIKPFGRSGRGETWIEAATRLCSMDDELAGRLDTETISKSKWRIESLKAYGNAIYWPVAYEIFKAIEKMELEIKL